MQSDAAEYMRADEAARYLSSTKSTLAKKRLNGDGPPYTTLGRIVLYRRADIDRWLAERLRHSTSEPDR